jgi:metallo-beta-lactamase class B
MRIGFCFLVHLMYASTAMAQPSPKEASDIANKLGVSAPAIGGIKEMFKSWVERTDPFSIIDKRIHYVGTRGLAAYLIETKKGLVLLDGALPRSAADIEKSIRDLGKDPAAIKFLLITHAHIDHAGTMAHFKGLASNPTTIVMSADWESLRTGGAADPAYGWLPLSHFPPVEATCQVEDGHTLDLDDVKLTARLGAGHSPGATTWIARITDGADSYEVVFPCCTTITPNYFVRRMPKPVVDAYSATFEMLASFKPRIWLPAHTEAFGDFEARRTSKDWRNERGYKTFVEKQQQAFERRIRRKLVMPRKPAPKEQPACRG